VGVGKGGAGRQRGEITLNKVGGIEVMDKRGGGERTDLCWQRQGGVVGGWKVGAKRRIGRD